LDANHDAKHGQRRCALFTLGLRLTPFAYGSQLFPLAEPPGADHKLARGAVGRQQDFCLWKESILVEAGFPGRAGPDESHLKSTNV
jgi:hypothetical protein